MNIKKNTKQKNNKNKGGGIILISFYSYFVVFFMFYVFYQAILMENSDFKYYTDLVLQKDNFKLFIIGLLLSYILVFSI